MTNLIIFILLIQVIHFLGTWKLYVKAGRKAWEAAIPIYNAYVLTKIIDRPWWWVLLLFFPVINLMMFPAFWVETVRSFGKEKTSEVLLVVFSLGFYIYYLNYLEEVSYKKERQLKPHTKAGEWVTSIVFAVVAATLVHTYFMRPYVIPTSSLEKSLLVGDYLFVSKFHYGARVPITPLALPMVHDTMRYPTKFRSYVKGVELPYFRLPGFQKIKRNDIVVFNWPTDTVYRFRDPSKRYVYKPVDKKSNYVKRCVGIPGDSLEIKEGYVFINGKQTVLPDRAKTQYFSLLETKKDYPAALLEQLGISEYARFYQINKKNFKTIRGVARTAKLLADNQTVEFETAYTFSQRDLKQRGIKQDKSKISLNLTDELFEELKKDKTTISIQKRLTPKGTYNPSVFPHDKQYLWSRDNFGPIYIPNAGKTVVLNTKTAPLYRRIIEEYEHNSLAIDGGKIYVNGQETDSYTFKQDYYWMMGDNRHNSEDARYWGYVPFDHVVGKPVLIWFSAAQNGKPLLKRIRWDRMFTTVHADGKPKSYLFHFIGLVTLLWGFSYFRKKKKKS